MVNALTNRMAVSTSMASSSSSNRSAPSAVGPLPDLPGEDPHLFDQGGQFGSLLARQSVAQRLAEASNVVPQGGIAGFLTVFVHGAGE